jgi:hypothetical protein
MSEKEEILDSFDKLFELYKFIKHKETEYFGKNDSTTANLLDFISQQIIDIMHTIWREKKWETEKI